jgi:hypothetical protein
MQKYSSLLRIARIVIASTSGLKPDVVVFSDFAWKSSRSSSSKGMQAKSFMVPSFPSSALVITLTRFKSSRVSKLTDETQAKSTNGTSDTVDDEDDEL